MSSPTLPLFVACLLFNTASAAGGQRKIYAAGSGLDMLSQPDTVKEIIALSGKPKPSVLYLGTATYDDPSPQKQQTDAFIAAGCSVAALNVAWLNMSEDEMRPMFQATDIVLVSGGNTLFAVDRFVKLGVDKLIKEAMADGKVMCGGSAGGIVWFDGGHSDSMEAHSYKNPPGPLLNPNLNLNQTDAGWDAWAYIRVPGMSLIPGYFCPHYDVTEGNGALRATDFTAQLQQHSGETGIAVDNWGALMIDGDHYTIISRSGKPGSVDASGKFTSKRDGRPGSWSLTIGEDGELHRTLVPTTGFVSDLLAPAKYIVQTSMLKVARAQNPDDGKPANWNITEHKPLLSQFIYM